MNPVTKIQTIQFSYGAYVFIDDNGPVSYKMNIGESPYETLMRCIQEQKKEIETLERRISIMRYELEKSE